MKQIKRIMAFALALVLALAMSITVFADDTTTTGSSQPKSTDTGKITVKNVEVGATVTAYKYVQADYTGSGLSGYSIVKDTSGKAVIENIDIYHITAENIISLAAIKDQLTTTYDVTDTDGDGNYTADVQAGSYLILVTGTNKAEIYNPMVVSVFYDTDKDKNGSNTTMTGEYYVDADSKITLLEDEEVYAKSDEPTVDKEITKVINGENSVDGKANTEESGNVADAAIGDIVEFTITTTIPAYSSAYENNLTFELKDTMAAGFTYVPNSGSVTVNSEDSNVSVVNNGQELTIDLSSVAEANYNKTTNVVVTYRATLTKSAAVSSANDIQENTNTVVLTYSTSPNGNTATKDDTTYSYTYSISNKDADGNVNGLLTKVDSDDTETKLAGAKFTLANEYHTYTITTDETGSINFSGLDAGTYKLTEIEAPKGYSLTNVVYTIIIDPTYEGETVTGVNITVTGSDGTSAGTNQGLTIPNTTLSSLPSTGGIGTTIFTIAGCLIMIAAAGMYFASRRKSAR